MADERVKEKLILEDFKYFGGKHCLTASLKNILAYHNLNISEEMLFGLGGGLSFIYWHNKRMRMPFIGGRHGKVVESLVDTCNRIGAEATVFKTASTKKGYEELKKQLRRGEPAYVFVDMPYLPYLVLPPTAHFGGHAIVVFGLDEGDNKVYIADRAREAVTATIDELNKARSSKFPPFPAENKLLEIKYPVKLADFKEGIKAAITESCAQMLKPPIKNMGLPGIKKWADEVVKWPEQFKEMELFSCLFSLFVYCEFGTGGSAFRPMYAQFLKEASSILSEPSLNDVAAVFDKSGKAWREITTAALPNWWPTLKRIRELSIEKNRIFEQQPPDAYKKMKKLETEITHNLIRKKAIAEFENLEEKDAAHLVGDLSQKILQLYEIESQAFEALVNLT